jgi:hypothetical protein
MDDLGGNKSPILGNLQILNPIRPSWPELTWQNQAVLEANPKFRAIHSGASVQKIIEKVQRNPGCSCLQYLLW